jgi:hypothetical protein
LADAYQQLAEAYVMSKSFARAAGEYDQAASLYFSVRDRGGKDIDRTINDLKTQADRCRQSTCAVPAP